TSSTRRFPAHPTAARRPDLAPGGASAGEGLPRPNDFSWFSEPVGSSNLSLLTIGGSIPKNAPASLRAPCYRLAQLADADVLSIDLVVSATSPSGWAFAGANSCPHVAEPESLLRIVNLLESTAAVPVEGAP